jgi:microcystin-dependent protein
MDPILGQIQQFGFAFQMQNWALCHGQQLSIQQYTALFALIGITFGGDGRNNFKLPDLRMFDEGGNPYSHGDKMPNGVIYLESQINISNGIFPSRD